MTKINLQQMFLKQAEQQAREYHKLQAHLPLDRMTDTSGTYKAGYTAALSDLQGKVDGLVEALDRIRCLALGGLDYTSTKKFHEMRSNMSEKIANEALKEFMQHENGGV
jgi:hypothetical protein